MIVRLKENVTDKEQALLKQALGTQDIYKIEADNRVLYQVKQLINQEEIEHLPMVEEIVQINTSYQLVSRDYKKTDTIIDLGDQIKIGGNHLTVIAGPCSVESQEQMMTSAAFVKAAGGQLLRGGAYKPRTSPYSFQGLEEEGLIYLRQAADRYGLKVITEVMDIEHVSEINPYTDVFQIGARNMQNFKLLEAVGKTQKPVALKRGMAATVTDLLNAAEYIAAQGNLQIILIERGIRTFETATRNTLDLNAVPVLKELTHLPIIVDPSHGIGIRKHVPAMAKAGIAAGAHGVMLEAHPDPAQALSDGEQSLTPEMLQKLVPTLRQIHEILQADI